MGGLSDPPATLRPVTPDHLPGRRRGLREAVCARVLAGEGVASTARAVDCSPATVMYYRRQLALTTVLPPLPPRAPLRVESKRKMVETRWGPTAAARMSQPLPLRRLRMIAAWVVRNQNRRPGPLLPDGVEILFFGPSLNEVRDHHRYRLGTVDDTSGDWRSTVS